MSTITDPRGSVNANARRDKATAARGGLGRRALRQARRKAARSERAGEDLPAADAPRERELLPGQVCLSIAGQTFYGRLIPGEAGKKLYFLEHGSGDAGKNLLVADLGQGPRCSCQKEPGPDCDHILSLRAAGILWAAPAPPPVPGKYRSLKDWAKNAPDEYNPWAGYSDQDLEDMARYFGEE